MDRILVFDKGCLAEGGTHAQLLQKAVVYARLWQMQAGSFFSESGTVVR
jgi:ATP-binding cassette subfamily B protein